jgi:hypothetical protein
MMPISERRLDVSDLGEVAAQLAGRARDAAYVAVGLGVLGLQRAQVRRHELTRRAGDLDDRVAQVRSVVSTGVQQFDEWFEITLQLLESSLQPLEDQLPEPARELADRALDGARELRSQLRQLVSPGT